MSLSQRLKVAEYDRRLAAGLPVDHLHRPAEGNKAKGDVRDAGAPVLDLTDAQWADVIELGDAPSAADRQVAVADRESVDLIDTATVGGGSAAIGPQVGQRSSIECPHCGGPTQVDLIDTVGHSVSLSCLSCYHMFRVEASV